MFGESILQRRNRVEHGRARTRGQRFNQRRVDSRKQLSRVRVHETFDFTAEKPSLEQSIENGFLRHQLVTDGVSDRLRQPFTMPRNHALRPDRDSKNLQRLIRMKQHPDRQPRRSVSVHRRNDNDGQTDQSFEGDGIDARAPKSYSGGTVADKSRDTTSPARELQPCTMSPASS